MYTNIQIMNAVAKHLIEAFRDKLPELQAAAQEVQDSSAEFAKDIASFLAIGLELADDVKQALASDGMRGIVSDHAAAVIDRLKADNEP